MRSPWLYLLLLLLTRIQHVFPIRCYSCANEFIVWGLHPGIDAKLFHDMFYFLVEWNKSRNGPDKDSCNEENAHGHECFILHSGIGRGCSSQFLTDDQHMHLGLGTHTKPSEIGSYLPADFDKLEIFEHWCFCATDYCNTQVCYSRPFGSSEFANSHIGKRLQYSSYNLDWRYRSSSNELRLSFLLLLWPLSALFRS